LTTPNSNNMYLGAGELFFDRFDANGNPTGLRHLGNVDAFTTTGKEEVVDKKSAMTGLRTLLAEVPKGFTLEIGIEASEWDPNNVALATLGTVSPFTQAANPTIAAGAINGGVAIALDTWYDLGSLNVTITDVKQGATTLNAAAYIVKTDVGMIAFLSSYTGPNAATAAITTWDGSCAAVTAKSVVKALSVSKIQGHLRYVSALDQANGPRVKVDVWKVNLYPDGDLGFIAEDFSNFKLKGNALADLTRAVGDQYMTVQYL
jgi:hypothetical protein